MSGSTSKVILNIGMIDVDLLDNGTRHPNLAQMKMSAFCKERGHNVHLIYTSEDYKSLSKFDVLIVSKVFTFTKPFEELDELLKPFYGNLQKLNLCVYDEINKYEKRKPKKTRILIGGTGFFEKDGGRDLHESIEHHMPDYNLYSNFIDFKIKNGRKKSYYGDYLNYSIGFTSRGCFRKCNFCVNKKYDHCSKHSPVSEFYDKNRKKIYLWDDNVFACAEWEKIFDELDQTGRPFQFRQGLDIRLLNDKKAERLAHSKYYGDYIFAFDHVDDYEVIENHLKLWRKYSQKETKVYLICAYDSWTYTDSYIFTKEARPYLKKMASLKNLHQRELLDIEFLFERIRVLMKYDCLPYIMRFEAYKQSEYRGMYIQIARWCNQPNIFKKMSFREFVFANQSLAKTNRPCSALRAYEKFINDCPEVAKKYFDMKYRIENTYTGEVFE